jgi:putative nucleotidyltransferase with HDIG domain
MEATRISRIRNVPTLPGVLSRLLQTMHDPNSSAADLEAILRNDQSMTSKLLAVANSAYYGFRHQITTVRRAVVAIGFNEVRNICTGLGLMSFLHPSTFRDPQAANQLWLHSLMVAQATRIVAKRTDSLDSEVAYTAGLLHDIGMVVLGAFFPNDLEKMQHLMVNGGLNLERAEQQMNLSHEQVGKALAKAWDLPPLFVQVLSHHHNPRKTEPYAQAVACTHCGDYLARDLGFKHSEYSDTAKVSSVAMDLIELDAEALAACRQRLVREAPRVGQLWRFMLGS